MPWLHPAPLTNSLLPTVAHQPAKKTQGKRGEIGAYYPYYLLSGLRKCDKCK
ncbi:MAG: hypothetical protein GTN69_05780 [Armatimonadetes bacterium]|nr:hypothetical protein [Armatimonadota bacterium]